MNTTTETRQVQVPHSYFQKAKSEYSDWRWAVIREFIQNSYVAQATNIDFLLTANEAGRIELQVSDDGTGMDNATFTQHAVFAYGHTGLEHGIGTNASATFHHAQRANSSGGMNNSFWIDHGTRVNSTVHTCVPSALPKLSQPCKVQIRLIGDDTGPAGNCGGLHCRGHDDACRL